MLKTNKLLIESGENNPIFIRASMQSRHLNLQCTLTWSKYRQLEEKLLFSCAYLITCFSLANIFFLFFQLISCLRFLFDFCLSSSFKTFYFQIQ